jgi:RNA polymerase sigma-70 factor, ECF subfamily
MAAFTKMTTAPAAAAPAAEPARARPRSAAEAHALHADFVWRSLARLGVRDEDLADMLQEVFLVVHRRLHTYDGSSKLTSWLFGICLRVAAAYRRRAHRTRERERPLSEAREPAAPADAFDPERTLAARQQLAAILDAMPLEKRAIFVMFEIDGMSSQEIADSLDMPVGTVHSRLYAARRAFAQVLERQRARAAREA